jgi:hypothetical protein
MASWFAGLPEPSNPASFWPPPSRPKNSMTSAGRTASASAKTIIVGALLAATSFDQL